MTCTQVLKRGGQGVRSPLDPPDECLYRLDIHATMLGVAGDDADAAWPHGPD